jgi:hypothetical protein
MKLNEKSKAFIEWALAIFLAIVCLNFYVFSYMKFSPEKAFRSSERTINYGPSQIVKELDKDGIRIYLARYKDWISAQAIERKLITFSHAGGNVTGIPIKYDEKVTYTWSGSSVKKNKFLWMVYGYVNDAAIHKITLNIKRGDKIESMEYLLDENRMFVFTWLDDNSNQGFIYKVTGTDKENNILYENKYLGS